ncbi:MAG: thioredoxin-disulfide reductase [Candidatus Omnitrophica bacterium]|nr:thioredoxin-disulfide reductase [Candidatus Omnitrophota bacterium]
MIYDVIIIGAGPAGLTAALYVLRANLRALIIEDPLVASQAAYAFIIENFPAFPGGISGIDLIKKLKEQVGYFGVEILPADVSGIKNSGQNSKQLWQVTANNRMYDTISVIVASGAVPKRLDIAGEREFIGRGVSYCAVCDGALFKDKNVVIAGGGDSAVEEALFLSRFAKKVSIVHRRDKLRAAKILQKRVFANDRIEIVWNSTIEQIMGGKTISGLRLRDVSTGALRDMDCQGLFVSIGKVPNTGFVKNALDIDKNGYIITGRGLNTSAHGVFACGDCRDTLFKQIVTACGDGAAAARSCVHYVDTMKGY